MGGQRCARPGCRAWAMRGRSYCRMHQNSERAEQAEQLEPELSIDGAADPSEEDRFQVVIPLDLITARVEALLAESRDAGGDELTLREEIGALRLVLARELAEEPDLRHQAASVPGIINTVIRAIQAQRLLSGSKAGAITEAITQVLIELGLGSDEDQ